MGWGGVGWGDSLGARAKDGAKTFGRAKDVDAAKRDTKTSQKKRAEGQDRKANVQAAQGKKARRGLATVSVPF